MAPEWRVWSVLVLALAQAGLGETPIASTRRSGYIPNGVIVKLRAAGAGAGSVKTSGAGPGIPSDPWARFRSRIQIRGVRQLRQEVSQVKRRRQSSSQVQHSSRKSLAKATTPDSGNIYRLEVNLRPSQSLDEVIALLRADSAVEYAERNQRVSIHAVPDDPYYPQQWALRNMGQAFPISGGGERTGTAGADIAIEQAWDVVTNATEVVVAVVDTGVDHTHRDLANRMWINTTESQGQPGVDDDENGYVDDVYGYNCYKDTSDPLDDNGHGTLCAGIIAAEIDNGTDIAGICPSARVMAVKNLDFWGSGDTFTSAEAIYYAVANGADVVSCSWGFESYSETLRQAVDFARRQGALVIVSAGNENSDQQSYPASYDAVISVAATDANDRRTGFSTYGDWVDIAAPGTMILSLRAADTDLYTSHKDYVPGDRFIPFGDPNATMYLASGTSTACPMVAGVAALVVAQWPDAQPDEIRDRLLMTADDLSELNPEYVGLLGSGRVNAFRAASPTFRGLLTLDRHHYHGQDHVQIQLIDFDLAPAVSTDVELRTDQGDQERVSLTRNHDRPWIFAGSIRTATGALLSGDDVLQVGHNEGLTALYVDQADEQGHTIEVSASAVTDTVSPYLESIHIETSGASSHTTIQTNEPTTVRILAVQAGDLPEEVKAVDLSLAQDHSLVLADIADNTEYALVVELTDRAGNVTRDDNDGLYYRVNTEMAADVYVPSQYPTIQEGIDHCWPGHTVWVADGVYTGTGNRDIDFGGKAITVRSENGPENCIIDCQGNETEPHRGFLFHNNEGPATILSGFTITNGWTGNTDTQIGGAILCRYAGPILENCIFQGNRSHTDGGALASYVSTLQVDRCVFLGNRADKNGGALYAVGGQLHLNDCSFIANVTGTDGGVFLDLRTATLINCSFTDNRCESEGAGVYNRGTAQLINCVFSGNRAREAGSAYCNYYSSSSLKGCVFTHNGEPYHSSEPSSAVDTHVGYTTLKDCLLLENPGIGLKADHGAVSLDQCQFLANGRTAFHGKLGRAQFNRCVIGGNGGLSGAIVTLYGETLDICNTAILGHQSDAKNPALELSERTDLTLTHSILWDNGPSPIGDIQHLDPNRFQISHCDIQGGSPGEGNIDATPMFVASSSLDPLEWDLHLQPASPCIDAGAFFLTSGDYGEHTLPLDGNADGLVRSDIGVYEFQPLDEAPVIGVNVSHMDFAAYQGAENPANQTLRIHNAGNGVLHWRLELDPACHWLSVARVFGQAQAGQMDSISVSVDIEDIIPGDYQGDLTIVSDSATNSPVVVPVQLDLSAPPELHVPSQFGTIQAAIDAVEPGGRIVVSPGRYYETLRFPGKDIVLCSVDPLDPDTVASTVIDGNQVDPVVTFSGNETPFSRLEGLTITGGRIAPVYEYDDGYAEEVGTDKTGAGISGNGTHATITRCVIKDNSIDAEWSLGAGISDCDGLISHCTIKNNRANGWDCLGGGLSLCDGTISHCVITGNFAYDNGGGLSGCSARITDCLIEGNIAGDDGGGISGGSGGVFNCVISGNTSIWEDGGGLSGISGPIANCLIAGNRSFWDGAGLDSCSGPISHCTIVGNVAGLSGGGISLCTGAITNCIIVDNWAELDGEQLWRSETPSYSCFPGAVDRGNIDIDPGFIRSGYWDPNGTPWDFFDDVWIDGDYHLAETSGCIDAGSNLPDVTTDFSGTPRPVDGNSDGLSRADMGCYEFNPFGRSLPILEVESRRFEFVADADGPAPETQFLRMRNWGSGGLHWQLAENCPWLTVTPSQGQVGVDWTALELSADHTGLEPGDYSCTLEIQSDDAVNSPSLIEVALSVQGPEFGLCPRHLELTILEGQSLDPAILSLRNHGSGAVRWQLYHDSPWLQTSQSQGNLSAAQAERVDIAMDVSGFTPGCYQTSLVVSDDADQGHEHVVPVIVNVESQQLHVPRDYPTIQSALDAALDGCTVTVADGTYTGRGNRQLRFWGKAITLESENGPDHCNIDCEQQARGFRCENFEPADSILEGFTILHRRGDLGGGILNDRARPTIRNCHILHCRSDQGAGGGIYAGPANSSIGAAEGFRFRYSSSLLIDSCVISYNTADDGEYGGRGGGICLDLDVTTPVEVRDCVISSNVAADHGGEGPTEDYAGVGGGVFCGRGPRAGASLAYDDLLIRCVITDNAATLGGAVAMGRHGVRMSHCTVVNNTASADGGGLYSYHPPINSSETQLDSCIFWNNSPNSLRAADELQSRYSDIEDGRSGTGNLSEDPLFVNSDNPIGLDNEWLTDDDGLMLQANSPCRNAASDGTHMGAYQH